MDASEWFTDSITVQSPTGLDPGGTRDIVWGPQRVIKGRYTEGSRDVEGPNGQVVTSIGTIRCSDPIAITDRVWPPGADTTKPLQARRPLLVRQVKDLDGYVLYRVELGR